MHLCDFFNALSFLTRFGPPKIVNQEDFPATLYWFPLVGLVVGVVSLTPALAGLFSEYAWVQGWMVTGMSLWLTRGLHADGLADIADAWGSRACGDRFWTILKDSRCGPFGVLGLVMALVGQILAFGILSGQGRLGAICWCFVLGRFVSVVVLCLCKNMARPGLSSLFAPGAGPKVFAVTLVQSLILGLALSSPGAVFWGLAAGCLVTFFLVRLARRQHGVNGDFLGAAMVLGELAGALGALV
ncbi:MAG: adenosylcobinamide-GDP ribazoletransferase [Desulfovibrio sp.]|nr:adenosylcobinamide-GDP ribazoletransferase [Desulfovibrio sp.]MBI4961533.1 adenosylcobinamide-GDP ribazoletransferase [Desulfovibrio sp.]